MTPPWELDPPSKLPVIPAGQQPTPTQTLLAQAEGYRRICMELSRSRPDRFRGEVQMITVHMAERGA